MSSLRPSWRLGGQKKDQGSPEGSWKIYVGAEQFVEGWRFLDLKFGGPKSFHPVCGVQTSRPLERRPRVSERPEREDPCVR